MSAQGRLLGIRPEPTGITCRERLSGRQCDDGTLTPRKRPDATIDELLVLLAGQGIVITARRPDATSAPSA